MQASTETEDERLRQEYLNHWHETWRGFTAALVSTEDFHAFVWTVKLLKSGICFAYFKSGVYQLKLHIYWRSWVPGLAITLIALVIFSYFGSLREIIRKRWCCPSAEMEGGTKNSCFVTGERCRWLHFHDAVVLYLGLMIIFNLMSACFRSPGVVLPNQKQGNDRENEDTRITDDSLKADSKIQNECIRWSSKDSRGGFCGIGPVFNIAREVFLVQNYYNLVALSMGSREAKIDCGSEKTPPPAFPSTQETFCNKCKIKRPPRCHHCSISDQWYVHSLVAV